LFPVCGRVPGGTERKTYKMMRRDLAAARKKWIAHGKTEAEKNAREKADFLKYRNSAREFADFRPKVAQTLARHSDIRLTLGVYTHAELADQEAAITALPAPPEHKRQTAAPTDVNPRPVEQGRVGNASCTDTGDEVPTMVPRGAEIGAVRLSSEAIQFASLCTVTESATGDVVASCAKNSRKKTSRPGGIRTPDQGIMSPLL
jgi:hypothetical protein